MRKINRIDYFCGAFLAYLISNKVEPMLFEAGENSKIAEFTIKDTTYKTFIKYSTKKREINKQGKHFEVWDIIFSANEIQQLEAFADEEKRGTVVCICTDEKLRDTKVAVIDSDKAIQCLGIGKDDKNAQRRISIKHQKSSSKFLCHGTAVSDLNAIEVPYNFEKYFGLGES